MKARIDLKKLFLTMTFTLLPFVAHAGSVVGGSDGGGGNTQHSTRADLEEIVANFNRHLWHISDNYLFGGPIKITNHQLNPELMAMTNQILGVKYFTVTKTIEEYMRTLKFEIVDRPCMDGGKATDASTQNEKGATVCLSAKRLARFPKSALKDAIIPLVFHEVAHQFGFSEKEAVAFQRLAELHLKYREIYLASLRARLQCAVVTGAPLTDAEKKEVLALITWDTSKPLEWPILTGKSKLQALMACATRAGSAGDALERVFNGNLWQVEPAATLTEMEKSILNRYQGQNYKEFSFLTMIKALNEPSISGYNNCDICDQRGLDPAYIMSLGAKAALAHIDREVGRAQEKIQVR